MGALQQLLAAKGAAGGGGDPVWTATDVLVQSDSSNAVHTLTFTAPGAGRPVIAGFPYDWFSAHAIPSATMAINGGSAQACIPLISADISVSLMSASGHVCQAGDTLVFVLTYDAVCSTQIYLLACGTNMATWELKDSDSLTFGNRGPDDWTTANAVTVNSGETSIAIAYFSGSVDVVNTGTTVNLDTTGAVSSSTTTWTPSFEAVGLSFIHGLAFGAP